MRRRLAHRHRRRRGQPGRRHWHVPYPADYPRRNVPLSHMCVECGAAKWETCRPSCRAQRDPF